jgi:two-component system response regulator NreC
MIMDKIKVLIADDHPIVRAGIRALLSNEPDYEVVGEADDGSEAVDKASQLSPDVVIMDIVMSPMDGILATERIKKTRPKTKVIVLSMYKQKEYVLRAFRAGAEGYMLKDIISEELLNALHCIKEGKRYVCPSIAEYFVEEYLDYSQKESDNPFDSLSLREQEVLHHILEGRPNSEIAKTLFISLATVKTHRNSIMHKLDVHDVASLTRLAVQYSFIDPAD